MGSQLVRSGEDRLTEVLVVGGGYWGTFVCARLRSLGLTVVCLDGGLPGAASRAAAGLVRASAWDKVPAGWWSDEHRAACEAFFQGDWVEETISNGRSSRIRGMVWCGRVVLEEGVAARVTRFAAVPEGWRVETDRGAYFCGKVVIAAGVWCDEILGSPVTGVEAAEGRALLGRGECGGVTTRAYRLPGDTRTRTLTVRPWEDGLRVGDTLPGREEEQLAEMREGDAEMIWGLRPKLPRLFVELVAPGCVVATGGYRNGLATAPGVALRVAQLLRVDYPADE